MRDLRLHAAVLLFAMAAWISINTIYVELPILSGVAPESWNLATYVVLIIQISCVAPAAYSLLRQLHPQLTKRIEFPLVTLMMLLTVVGLILASILYKDRTNIGGTEHSVGLLVSILLLCIPCTMADVLYLPIVGTLHDDSLVATFYIGMGVGAFAPSAVSFAQGTPIVTSVHDNSTGIDSFIIEANFSFPVFVYIMVCLAGISYAAYAYIFRYSRRLDSLSMEKEMSVLSSSSPPPVPSPPSTLSRPLFYFLIAVSFIAGSLQNAILPGIMGYAAQPYGQQAYHLATTLFVLTNPVFCLVEHLVSFSSFRRLVFLSVCSSVPSLFIVVLAFRGSPAEWDGVRILLLVCAGVSAGVLSLLRTSTAVRLQSAGGRSLFYCGAATQAGSCVGALTLFLLANILHVFPAS